MRRFAAIGLTILWALLGPRTARAEVDATTLRGKVMCGYQGWFRFPGDPVSETWVHWSRDGSRIAPETLTFEMWPDMTPYPAACQRVAGAFTYPDGKPATLFSSACPEVVDIHFRWMRQYGIDGVFVQRFLGGLDGAEGSARAAHVLKLARAAAERTGRTFAVEYDMSGTDPATAIETMRRDWRYLEDVLHITRSPRYIHHAGKPVLAVFGFYADRFSGAAANRIIDSFHADPRYDVALVGAGQWYWRSEKDLEWQRAFRRFTAYSPWNVGNATRQGGTLTAATGSWAEDMAEARKAGMLYLPVLYPGFSWDNLTRRPAGSTLMPRRKGAFLREQFDAARDLGVTQAFVAMFDEVDEGTAIFKVTDQPPTQAHFVGLEGMPADTYLRITGEGTRAVHEVAARKAGR